LLALSVTGYAEDSFWYVYARKRPVKMALLQQKSDSAANLLPPLETGFSSRLRSANT
jgi:hypothetical protein